MEKRIKKRFFSRRAQITVFVIIAIILVLGIAGFFIAKTYFFQSVPKEVQPLYDYYSSCISNVLNDGASIMASQGGYLYYEDFEPGSQYAPFSSVLDFMGMGVPYWYYLSANGIKKEQVPTRTEMQKQLATYLEEQLSTGVEKCDLTSFEDEGFKIVFGNASGAKTIISDTKISASVSKPLIITYNGQTYTLKNFDIQTSSKLGELYTQAKAIYDYELKNSFIENYSIDVLYNYAPVSGVVINCSPAIWVPNTVFNDLKDALSANIGALKVKGNYYSNTNAYFIVGNAGGLNVGNNIVSFLYSKEWPSRFEVWPTKNGLMKAESVGTQPGLSVMGFCYAPYKFVYDMYFPVLVQLTTSDSKETFQFPVSVVISKNNPREAVDSEYIETTQSICDNANSDLKINTYDINLNPVEANVKFKCITDTCELGNTVSDNFTATLEAKVAQCGNGVLIIKAEGYKEKREIISTNEQSVVDVILEKEYGIGVEIYVDGKLTRDNSILIINKVLENTTVFEDSFSYPQGSSLKLSEGNYKFDLKVYTSGNINIPASKGKQCSDVPKSGVLGLIGFTEEKCVEIEIPSQQITNIPLAGGFVYAYLTPDILENSKIIRIYANSIKTPATAEEVGNSFDEVETKKISMELL